MSNTDSNLLERQNTPIQWVNKTYKFVAIWPRNKSCRFSFAFFFKRFQVKLVILGGGNTTAALLLIYNLKVLLGTICKRLNNTLQSKEINITLRVSGLVFMKNW